MTRTFPYAMQRRMRSWLAQGLLAVGFLAAFLPALEGALHMVLTQHVRCAAHGELMHAEHRTDEAAHRAADGAESAIHGDHDAPHEHDHCARFLPAPSLNAPASDESGARAAFDESRPATAPPAWASHSIGLLHLSPKTSPPAA